MNAQPCVVRSTTGTAAQARRLVTDILHAPALPDGPISCPMDDGAEVQLVFGYGRGASDELALVSLTGCRAVRAPGRGGRVSTSAISADLMPLAPPAWRCYLTPALSCLVPPSAPATR